MSGIFSAIGGLFGFGEEIKTEETPIVAEASGKKKKGSMRSSEQKINYNYNQGGGVRISIIN